MTDYDRRLQQQNDGTPWRDCNAAGHPHRWVPDFTAVTPEGARRDWYRCTRCPVSTITTKGRPNRFLARAS